jgi:hypothetical protein
MSNLAEYFAAHRPTAKWQHGDRVQGKFHGVPFVGTCGGEGMVNEIVGVETTVFIDLPIKVKNAWHQTFIKVKPKDLKKFPTFELEEKVPAKIKKTK